MYPDLSTGFHIYQASKKFSVDTLWTKIVVMVAFKSMILHANWLCSSRQTPIFSFRIYEHTLSMLGDVFSSLKHLLRANCARIWAGVCLRRYSRNNKRHVTRIAKMATPSTMPAIAPADNPFFDFVPTQRPLPHVNFKQGQDCVWWRICHAL